MRNFQFLIFLSAFALYSFLAVFAPSDIWNSPDETANAFFISRLAQGQGLAFFDPAVVWSGGLIHPRSVSVSGGLLVPGSFIGMIFIYALPAALIGARAAPFLTPFFTAAALIAFGRLLQKIVSRRVAMLSVLLALTHPALWYYANRGLFHNVVFLDFLILALFFAVVRPFAARRAEDGPAIGKIMDAALAAGFFAAAIFTRTFEAIWLLPLAAFLLWKYRKHVSKPSWIVYGCFALVSVIILVFVSRFFYGSLLPAGYGSFNLFPFGFSLRHIARNIWQYGLLFFWWYAFAAGAGAVVLLRRRLAKQAPEGLWLLSAILLVISAPLVLIYGSGYFLDTPDPRMITIGTSTVRYWLPLYIGGIPLGAWFLDLVAQKINRRGWRNFFLIFALLAGAVLSFRTVFYGAGEGLAYVSRELRRYGAIRKIVLGATPENAVIITDKSDKIFFPHRRVVADTGSEAVIRSLKDLSRIGPLYLYALRLDEDDPRIKNYNQAGFSLRETMSFGAERLYELAPK